VETARNVVLKRLSITAERYIVYFNFVIPFAIVKIREVRIRTKLSIVFKKDKKKWVNSKISS